MTKILNTGEIELISISCLLCLTATFEYNMRKILIIVITAFMIIIIANVLYYKGLYDKQINYRVKLLDRQAQMLDFLSTVPITDLPVTSTR